MLAQPSASSQKKEKRKKRDPPQRVWFRSLIYAMCQTSGTQGPHDCGFRLQTELRCRNDAQIFLEAP